MARGGPGERRGDDTAKPAVRAAVGHEAELWARVDELRGSMDVAEYKHVVLGLIFLKFVSDAFDERHMALLVESGTDAAENRDECLAEGAFWIPPEARWSYLKAQARQPSIGQAVDDAMTAVEDNNPALEGVLPKEYARPALDKRRLAQLIDAIGDVRAGGGADTRSRGVHAHVYESFLSRFASAEGRKGGEFYTPRCVVRLLVEMLEPRRGRVYDPCCGSSGMLVQSVESLLAHATDNGDGDVSIWGQESSYTTWQLAKMNLAIRGIEGQIAHGDSFHDDRHPDLEADFILASPPFNAPDWGGEHLADDRRWKYGVPPNGNANFAWVQHVVRHLASGGAAGLVLANGSMSSIRSGEGTVRKKLIEAGLVECIVALPGQLFYSTQISACVWFLAKDRGDENSRDRRGRILFIDAHELGRMVTRTRRALTEEDIARIAGAYRAWRDKGDVDAYVDVSGFCRSVPLEEVRRRGHGLTPSRYVGAPPRKDDREPFEEKMRLLVAKLREQYAEGAQLDSAIEFNLRALGFWEREA